MPRTLAYRPTLIDGFISLDRINSYQTVFHPRDDVELMGVYLWNAHVCGTILPLMNVVEIALRNAIDQPLRAALGSFWWSGANLHFASYHPGMQPKNFPFPVSAVRTNFAKAAAGYIKDRQARYNTRGHISPTHGGVIAKTEFSTWQFLLDPEFMGPGLIWPQYLGQVFRGPWPSAQAGTTLNHLKDLVKTVREFRNRLFHHEPAWKAYSVSNESDAIAHVRTKIDKIVSLAKLIHPENVRLLEKNGFLQEALRACSPADIRRFQHLTKIQKINSIARLGALVDQSKSGDQLLHVKVYRGSAQRFWLKPA